MDKTTGSIIDEYLSYVKLYEAKYDKYLVFIMIGSFYECYSIIEDDNNLKDMCNLLNILLTRKNKTIKKISKSNPLMCGIPCCSLEKYLGVLIENNYTVIVYNQNDIANSKKKNRILDKIYSKGTYIDIEKDNSKDILTNENIILSIYRETIKDNDVLGISTINLATGEVNVLELYNNNDMTKLLEDLNKIIIMYKPKEIIYSYEGLNNDNIYKLINNRELIFHDNKIICPDYFKISYQNEFFKLVYKNYNMGFLSAIEYLDMEKINYGRTSLVILLNFAYSYDNMIIENINKPTVNINNNVLNLHNNALEQLNVFSLANTQTYKYNSLYDVINNNSTRLGMRLLKKLLSEPIIDVEELNRRYSIVEGLMKNKNYKVYESELKNIIDIEKYHKSLGIMKLQPYQYGRLHKSYTSILNLIKTTKKSVLKEYFDYTLLEEYNLYYEEYNKYFDIDNLEKYSFNFKNVTILNIFNKGMVNEIDEIINNKELEKAKLDTLVQDLTNLMNDSKFQIEIKCNDTNGYYLALTKIRATKLKKLLDSNNMYPDLVFENKIKSSTYITSNQIKEISKKIIISENKLYDVMKDMYYNITISLYKKYYNVLTYVNHFISYTDVFMSFAKASDVNNYSKPLIDLESNKSYIDIKNIRHPIVELLSTKTEYVTNNISINTKDTGMLLYGTNGSGKSTIMKAIGLNLILAQIGCYTASTEFKYYPYISMFTRINHVDNIFKGYSSYEVEIMELKNILKYSNENSLVLGDELLSSTESISAISLISATINHFLSKDISFLFASHLFEIPKYIEKELKTKLYIGHLKTIYDSNKKCFIYNRKLEGGLPMSNYGIVVAQNIIDSHDIIKSALQIQNKILNSNTKLLENKKSKYNKELYVNECYICSDQNIKKKSNNEVLEVHHVVYQSDFLDSNTCMIKDKEHIKKNQLSNLVTLCSHHHDEVHNNKIIMNSWVETSMGAKLDYKIIK